MKSILDITRVRKTNDFIWNRMLELAKKRGILVWKAKMPKGLRGLWVTERTNNRRIEVIVINNCLDPKNRNYTMAHELGHAKLHCNTSINFLRDEKEKTNEFEKEADRFAEKLINLLSMANKHGNVNSRG